MFKEERTTSHFNWELIGDVQLGRPNLGTLVPVDVYRLMQFTLRDAMIQKYGVDATDQLFFEAGKKAGEEFYANILTKNQDFGDFIENLQEQLKFLKVGILRVEKADLDKMNFTLTVAEDLDCSGLPVSDEEICVYDEGFIAGLLYAQTGEEFYVKEIDCWCSGDRVCRFDVKPLKEVMK